MDSELGSTIYVETEMPIHELRALIASLFCGDIEYGDVKVWFADEHGIGVEQNQVRNKQKALTEVKGFSYFSYILDIEPSKSITSEEYIPQISKLLCKLEKSNCKAVIICNFTDRIDLKYLP